MFENRPRRSTTHQFRQICTVVCHLTRRHNMEMFTQTLWLNSKHIHNANNVTHSQIVLGVFGVQITQKNGVEHINTRLLPHELFWCIYAANRTMHFHLNTTVRTNAKCRILSFLHPLIRFLFIYFRRSSNCGNEKVFNDSVTHRQADQPWAQIQTGFKWTN